MKVRKILHVEDDSDIREITRLALVDFGGFDVLQCASGAEAILQAVEYDPDLIVMDVMMPGLSGIETLAALQKFPELISTPAVFMTSKDMSPEHHTDLATKALGVIPKPFDPIALPDQLRKLVEDAYTA